MKSSSRGKTIALAGVGIVFGEVFALGILLNLTKTMNYYDAFAITSCIVFVYSMFFLWSIKEPDFETMRDQPSSKHQLVAGRQRLASGLDFEMQVRPRS